MKLITILFGILLFSIENIGNKASCQEIIIKDIKVKVEDNTEKYMFGNIIGEWTIYAYVTNIVEFTECNSCPKVVFKFEQSAIITYPDGKKEFLIWELKNDTLRFIGLDKQLGNTFYDSVYQFSITKFEKYEELRLKQIEKEYSYILNR